jgi:hypothetical protein
MLLFHYVTVHNAVILRTTHLLQGPSEASRGAMHGLYVPLPWGFSWRVANGGCKLPLGIASASIHDCSLFHYVTVHNAVILYIHTPCCRDRVRHQRGVHGLYVCRPAMGLRLAVLWPMGGGDTNCPGHLYPFTFTCCRDQVASKRCDAWPVCPAAMGASVGSIVASGGCKLPWAS